MIGIIGSSGYENRPFLAFWWRNVKGKQTMIAFHMNASLMIGHTQIDAEHEHILLLLDQFANCLKTDDKEGCAEKLGELTEALDSHLESEEKIMTGLGYPDIDNHRAQHQRARLKYLALIKKSQRDGFTSSFADDLIAILSQDLIFADMDFKAYLKKLACQG